MFVSLEKHLVRAYNVGIGIDAVVEATSEIYDFLHTVGREEGVAINLVGLLADTVNTSCSLDKSDYGPWKVVIDNYVSILQVVTFGKHICCDEYASLFVKWVFPGSFIADR